MTPLERELRRQRRLMMRREQKLFAEMARTYGAVQRRLQRQYDELIGEIDAMRRRGEDVNVTRLDRLRQHRQLLDDVQREIWAFGRQATEITANGQSAALSDLNGHMWKLTETAIGAAPGYARASVEGSFFRLSDNALRKYVGFASDGGALADLFADLPGRSVKKIRDQLAYSIATGQSPRVAASEFARAAQTPLARALTITRTETMRAYNAASIESFTENADVVTGWIWVASLSTRTCPACWAMHGTEHSNDETLNGHPRCRCAAVPKTKSWKELGFDGIPDGRRPITPGSTAFDRLPPADQRTILGPGRYDAYKDGSFGFKDLATQSHSDRWGSMRRTATLEELTA